MRNKRQIVSAAMGLVVLGAVGGIAFGSISNGSFDSGLDSWLEQITADSTPLGEDPFADAEVINDAGDNKLHALARNTYEWIDDTGGGYWDLAQNVESKVIVSQGLISSLYAPAGYDELEFNLAVNIAASDGIPSSAMGAYAEVKVIYTDGLGQAQYDHAYLTASASEADYTLSMAQIDSNLPVSILITAKSALYDWLLDDPNVSDPDPLSIRVDAYADDFVFVPEPCSVAMLMCGAALMLRRRRSV